MILVEDAASLVSATWDRCSPDFIFDCHWFYFIWCWCTIVDRSFLDSIFLLVRCEQQSMILENLYPFSYLFTIDRVRPCETQCHHFCSSDVDIVIHQ